MNYKKKKLIIYTLVVCFCIVFASCSLKMSIETVCTITSPKMGDSKIFFDKLIASTEGHLILFNFDGSVFKEFKDVSTNWISTCESEQFVIADIVVLIYITILSKDFSKKNAEVLVDVEEEQGIL